MKIHSTQTMHKVLTVSSTLVAIVFAYLFLSTLFDLHSLQKQEARVATSSTPNYLHDEEMVVVLPKDTTQAPIALPVESVLFEYIEVIEGCGPHFEGGCLNVRSGPGIDYPVVSRLRTGAVLKVGGKVERDGKEWYKIVFDEWIRYPERVSGDWYISNNYVRTLFNEGVRTMAIDSATTTKRIVVSRGEQMLYAYDGDVLYMKASISTGVELNPTPRGRFTIFRKTPSRYMQGPIPEVSEQYWDLPGVPWNLYFSHEGAVIHRAYWHDNFGKPSSHGCVNIIPTEAEKLYLWAELGTLVIVRD